MLKFLFVGEKSIFHLSMSSTERHHLHLVMNTYNLIFLHNFDNLKGKLKHSLKAFFKIMLYGTL